MTDILVVDDDIDIRLLICTLLTQNGYQACPAKDYGLAMMTGRARIPDIVIADFDLGAKLDGVRMAKILRRQSPAMRTIVITSNPTKEVRKRAAELGFQLLPKPFSPKRLLAAVEQAEADLKRIEESCSTA